MNQPGDLDDRLRTSDEAVRLCQLSGDLDTVQFAHVVRMLSLLEAGRLDEVQMEARASHEAIRRRRSNDTASVFVPLTHAGLFAYIDGRLRDVEKIAKDVASIAARTGDLAPRSVADVEYAFLFAEHDQPGASLDLVRFWADLLPYSQPWQTMMTMFLARAGRDSECRVRLSAYIETNFELQSDWHWLYSMAFLADACVTMRDREAASVVYDLLSPYGDRCITIGAACIFLGSVERYLGRLAEVLERHAAAHEHFERAHAVHSKSGARLMLAHSLTDHVLLLERARELGRGERAAELRVQASKLASEIGSTYLQRRLTERV